MSMSRNLPALAERRTPDIIAYRVRIGSEVEARLRRSVPRGVLSKKQHNLLKVLKDFAVFEQLREIHLLCPADSEGRYALAEVFIGEIDAASPVEPLPLFDAVQYENTAEHHENSAVDAALIEQTPSAWQRAHEKVMHHARALTLLARTLAPKAVQR